jgi:hypothetical protein
MYPLMFLLKCLVVGALGLGGVLSLSRGFGMPIPFLEYGALEAWNVIVGAGLLALSLGCAFFWRAPRRRKVAKRDSFLGIDEEWLLQATTTGPHLFKRRR